MVKLPDSTIINSVGLNPGRAPSELQSNRAIARIDASPIAKGAEEYGRAVSQGGQAIANAEAAGAAGIARGEAAFGKGVSDIGNAGIDVQLANDRLDFSRANSNFLTKKTELDATLDTDTDYGTIKDRYSKALEGIRSESAGLIGNPNYREKFTLDTAPQVAAGVAKADDFGWKGERSNKVADVTQRLDDLRNSALRNTDPAARPQLIAAGNELIQGLVDGAYIDPATAQKYRAKWTQDYSIAQVEGMAPEDRVKVLSPSVMGKDAVLDRIGGAENATGNPAARNPTTSAMGNFQFTNQTWLDVIQAHRPDLLQGRSPKAILDLRADPKLSREMAGYLTDDNAAVLRSQGITPSPTNLYLAHFLGVGDAAKVINAAPGTPVSDVVNPASIDANKSVLQGKTTDTVASWAAGKMGGSTRGKGDIIDFIPEDKRIDMLRTANEQVAAGTIDNQRALKIQQQQIKDASDVRENELLQDLYSDSPKTNAKSIVNDPSLTREAKERMIIKSKQALEDSNSKADKTYGPGFYEAYQLVHSPDGTPGRITDPTELYSRVGPRGDLTVAGVDKLVAEIQGRKTPEGVSEGEMKKQFMTNAKVQISGSDEGLHIKDPKGDQLYLKWMAQALPAYDEARKSGKTAAVLLNPDSPDYIGKSIEQFKRPMNQWFGDVVQDSPVHKGVAPPATSFDIKTVKSLDDLVSAYRSGKVNKAQADQMAIDNGWAAKRVPTSTAPQAPISGDNSAPPSNLAAADAALKLTPQEKALYQRHLTNLNGTGGVDNPPTAENPQGSRSTLFQTTVEHDGKFYAVPTVWNGKILADRTADGKFAGISKEGLANVKREGWDKFPSYKTEAEAEARYQQMHDFMDRDTGEYFRRKQASR